MEKYTYELRQISEDTWNLIEIRNEDGRERIIEETNSSYRAWLLRNTETVINEIPLVINEPEAVESLDNYALKRELEYNMFVDKLTLEITRLKDELIELNTIESPSPEELLEIENLSISINELSLRRKTRVASIKVKYPKV
jgi:hypothetical protein